MIKLIRPVHDDMVIIKWEHGETINTFDHPFYSVTKNTWVSYKPNLTLDRYDFNDVQQLLVGDVGMFLDKNDFISQIKLKMELKDLKENKIEIQKKIDIVKKEQDELLNNSKKLERFAREKYLMKKKNEDVYIIEFDTINQE